MAKRIVRKDGDIRKLSLTERLKMLDEVRREMAALDEKRIPKRKRTAKPATVTVDAYELVSTEEAAELRKMWGNE